MTQLELEFFEASKEAIERAERERASKKPISEDWS